MDAINVRKSSLQSQCSPIIRRPVTEKGSPMDAANVGILSLGSQNNSLYIRELIQERDLSDAEYVIKPSWLGHISLYIRELTHERNHTNARIVRKPSQKSLSS